MLWYKALKLQVQYYTLGMCAVYKLTLYKDCFVYKSHWVVGWSLLTMKYSLRRKQDSLITDNMFSRVHIFTNNNKSTHMRAVQKVSDLVVHKIKLFTSGLKLISPFKLLPWSNLKGDYSIYLCQQVSQLCLIFQKACLSIQFFLSHHDF